jgi:hypothetical protein
VGDVQQLCVLWGLCSLLRFFVLACATS